MSEKEVFRQIVMSGKPVERSGEKLIRIDRWSWFTGDTKITCEMCINHTEEDFDFDKWYEFVPRFFMSVSKSRGRE